MSKRTAVSVILTRNPNSDEVYLVERNPALKFFGGYLAFPGGTLDKGDRDIPVENPDRNGEETAFIVAAAREVFEETGVLLVQGADKLDKAKRDRLRQQMLDEVMSFEQLIETEKMTVDAGLFHPVCSLLTPEFAPVRYDTRFLWARIPEDQEPEIWPGELIKGDFISAEKAVAAWRSGDLMIVPPVIFMLLRMLERSLMSAIPRIQGHAEAYRVGQIHEIYFTPGVQMLPLRTRTLLPATHTNCYLVGEKKQYIVDPAPSDPHEKQRLWDYLDLRKMNGVSFEGILLTHHHSDHIGALSECMEKYDLPVLAHENTSSRVGVPIARHLKDGERLPLGTAPDGSSDWELEVYHTPGHASGHLAFRENRYGAVLAGDLISTLSTIVIAPPDGHMATYIQSLNKLLEVTDGTIYPGHGPALHDGKRVLQRFIEHRMQRERKLYAALDSEPREVRELVAEVYDDVDSSIWPVAELSLQAGLQKLVEEGRAVRSDSGFTQSIFRILAAGEFERSQVKVEWQGKGGDPTPEQLASIEAHWQREVAGHAEDTLFNGRLCSLKRFGISGDLLTLHLAEADYCGLLYSNHQAKMSAPFESQGPLSRVLGISIMVETTDNQFLLIKRSENVGECPGMIDVPGGHIHPAEHATDDTPDPFFAMTCEIKEELAIDCSPEELSCLGIVETGDTVKPEMIFRVPSSLHSGELVKIARTAASPEIEDFLCLEKSPAAIKSFIKEQLEEISPSACGALALYAKSLN